MKKILLSFLIPAVCTLIMVCTQKHAQAMTPFLDGKLLVSGFVKESVYYQMQPWGRSEIPHVNDRIDFLHTSAFIEGLYKMRESDDLNIQIYSGLKWWREASELFNDRKYKDMSSYDRYYYNYPRSFEKDVLTEAYVDIERGPWQIRAGKQIVIWGQLDTNRVADVVNPLDLRWGVPGMDSWEEIKKGLWMIRTFYTSQLPGQLVFEFLFNPGHYVPQYMAYVGTHWGPKACKARTGFTDNKEMGFWPWIYGKVYRDMPYFNTNNYEWGFRIQGHTLDFDWTLLYWNALQDWGIFSTHDGAVNKFSMQYVTAGIKAAMTGSSLNPGRWPDYRVFKFKRYQTIGGTVQTYVPWLHKSTWDFEWFYEIGTPFNKGKDGNDRAIYDETRRDVLGLALKYTDRFPLPGFLENLLKTNKNVDVALTYFWEKIFDDSTDIIKADRNHYPGDSSTDGASFWAKIEMFNTSLVFVPVGQYLFRTNRWYAVFPVTYFFPRPYDNLRATLGFKLYGAKRDNPMGNSWDRRDSIIFRLEYQF